jgi:GrpB-like predicted nucleotidyltransferase (UPF0157 family)
MQSRPEPVVEVVPSRGSWPAEFERERAALAAAVGAAALSIEHIGSTAVPGLAAKPTIDILLVVDATEDFLEHLAEVEALGYDHRGENAVVGSATHLFLRKVVAGRRTHHLHVLTSGSPEIDDYRLFRDALRNDRALARDYEQVKLALAARHATDRPGYVANKARWVDARVAALRRAAG